MAELFTHLSVTILDSLGVNASQPYYLNLDDSFTVADIVTAAQAILTPLDAVTDGQIVKATLDISVPLPGGIKSSPASTSEVERGGLFNFLQQNVKYRFGILVPSLKKSLIVNGKINLADAAVTAWLALMTALGGELDWISTGGNVLTTFSDALVTFRKHRKAEDRRSYEVS